MMTGQEAIKYIEAVDRFRIRPGLEAVGNLLNQMGDPQEKLKIIHIAGTNGKGSTASFISSILKEAGYKVGLFTSPSLESFNERVRVNDDDISDDDLGKIVSSLKTIVDGIEAKGQTSPTEFEIVTAVAFEYFCLKNVDFAVIEVGMGGRFDSTNIIKSPLVSVITPVDLDHVAYLGDTYAKVAYEKAGIIKDKGTVVMHPQQDDAQKVIIDRANEVGASLRITDFQQLAIIQSTIEGNKFTYKGLDYEIGMLGTYQTQNASVAIDVIEKLNEMKAIEISGEIIHRGLKKSRWPGRLEVMRKSPYLIIDGSHNLHGIEGLKKSLKSLKSGREITGIVGIFEDKDVDSMLKIILPELDKIVVTEPNSPRGMKAEDLGNKITALGRQNVVESKNLDSLRRAMAISEQDAIVIVFGCLFMAGQMRTIINKEL